MNISFFELENFEKEYYTKQLKGHTLRFDPRPLSPRRVQKHKDAEVIVVFIFSQITEQVLDKFPKLKCICTMSTGYDHIDIAAAKKRGIRVCSVPAYGQNTVAEHAFGLLQALNRNIIPAVQRTRQCDFDYKGLLGVDLAGKTLGIIGTGKIGQYMIRYAKAFGMQVIAYDAYKNPTLAKDLDFRYVTLPALCKQADFITLHVPLLPETHHLLGKEEFALMKPSVQIINTSRGPLVHTKELIKALDKKKIRGAALDVLELENDLKQETRLATALSADNERMCQLVENHNLIGRDNVIITPHLAFYTEEAVRRIMDTTIKNIKGHSKNRYFNKIV
jgi:D-lactate dehydrogenase